MSCQDTFVISSHNNSHQRFPNTCSYKPKFIMNITLGSAPVLVPPINMPQPINAAPTNAEVARAVMISTRVKRQKLEHPTTVSDQQLRDAVVYEKEVVEAHGGAAVAPPWFAGALTAALTAALEPIIGRLDDVRDEVRALRTDIVKVHNSSATLMEHTILPVRVNNVIPVVQVSGVNVAFPATVADLQSLDGPQVNAFLTVYGQGTGGTIQARKNRLAGFLGLRVRFP